MVGVRYTWPWVWLASHSLCSLLSGTCGLWEGSGPLLDLKEKKYFYFIFWLCCFFIAACGLSLVAVSGGYTLLSWVGFSLPWLLDAEQGSRCLGSVIEVHLSLAALRHMGSSWTRDETSVPCIARRILNHCFPGGASGKEHACQCRIHESISSVAQSCPTLCDPKDCIMPGLPVPHQLWELAQTHVHWIGDAIQPSHPLLFPSPPAFNLSYHQGLF